MDQTETNKKDAWGKFGQTDNMSLKVQGLSPIPYHHNTSASSNNSYFWSPDKYIFFLIQKAAREI